MTDVSRGKGQAPPDNTLADRRRPGRMANVNPQLIPILRQSHPEKLALLPEADLSEIEGKQGSPVAAQGADDLAPARGILLAVLLGGLMWIAILWALKLAFHLRVG